MAQVVRIIFRLQQEGEQLLKSIPRGIEELNRVLKSTSSAPLEQVSEAFKNIDTSTKATSKALDEIKSTIVQTFKEAAKQTTEVFNSSVDNVAKETSQKFETTFSRLTTISTIAAIGVATTFETLFTPIIKGTQTVGGAIQTTVVAGLGSITSSASTLFGLVTGRLLDIKSSILSIGGITSNFIFSSQTILGFIGQLGIVVSKIGVNTLGFAGGLILAKSALREISVLGRRILGQTEANLTPLQRVSNIVNVVDTSFRNISLTLGASLKTLGLFGASFVSFFALGPVAAFAGALATVNSFLGNFVALFKRSSLSTLAFFGSAKAQLGLIFLDLRNIAAKALPQIATRAKVFASFQKNIEGADKSLRLFGKGAKDFDSLKILSNAKLPLAGQFQIFSQRVTGFFTSLDQSLNRVTLLLSKAFNLTDNELADIDATSKKITNDSISGINKFSDGLKKAFGTLTGLDKIKELVGDALNSVIIKVTTPFKFLGQKLFQVVAFPLKQLKNLVVLSVVEPFKVAGQTTKRVFQESFKAISGASKNVFSKLRNGFRSVFSGIGSFFKSALGSVVPKQGARQINLGVSPEQLAKTKNETKSLTENIQTVANVSSTVTKSVKKEVEEIIKKVFDLSTITKKLSGEIKQIQTNTGVPLFKEKLFPGKASSGSLQAFIREVEQLSRGSGKLESVQKNLKGFLGLLGTLSSSKFGRKLDLGSFFRFSKEPDFIQAPKDLDNFRKKFEDFSKALGVSSKKAGSALVKELNQGLRDGASTAKIQVALEKLLSVFLDFIPKDATAKKGPLKDLIKSGKEIPKQLGDGMRSGHKELDKAAGDAAERAARPFPRSLAKTGPLRNLSKMGKEIVKQLGQGMKSGQKEIDKSAGDVAERIAKYFPRSPALLGALIALPKMGYNIAGQIADGIRSGIQTVLDAVSELTDRVAEAVNSISVVGRISENVGVSIEAFSALNAVVERFGGSVQDLQFPLNNLNKILAKPLEKETKSIFKRLKIDLDEIRKAAQPNLALFQKLGEVIANSDQQSRGFQDAIQTLGISGQSSLIAVFREAGNLDEALAHAAKSGVTLNKTFVENSKAASRVIATIKQVRDTIFNSLLEEILPTIIQVGEIIIRLVEENRAKINALLQTVGQGFVHIADIFISFLNLVFTEPEKGLDILKGVFNAIFSIVQDSIIGITNFVTDYLGGFFRALGVFILSLPISILESLFQNIKLFIERKLTEIVTGALEIFNKLLGELKPGIRSFLGLDDLFKESVKLERMYGDLAVSLKKESKNINEIVDKAVNDGIDSAKKLVAETNKAAKLIFNQDTLNEVLSRVKQFSFDLAKSFNDSPLKNKVSALATFIKKTLSGESFSLNLETQKRKLKEQEEAPKKAIEPTNEPRPDTFGEEEPDGAGKKDKKLFGVDGSFDFNDPIFDQLEKDREKKIKEEEKRHTDLAKSVGNAFTTAFDIAGKAMQRMYEQGGKHAKKFFFAMKALKIGEAVINGVMAVQLALADSSVTSYTARVINAATAATLAAANVAQIVATTIQGFATGGEVNGPGGVDKVPARLTAGEYVQPVPSVQYYGVQVMEAIRRRALPRNFAQNMIGNLPSSITTPPSLRFNEGGVAVSPGANGVKQNGENDGRPIEVNLTNVNVPDMSLVERYLASNKGEHQVLNIIGNNPDTVRKRIGLRS